MDTTEVDAEAPHALFEKRDHIATITLNRPGAATP
jgi:hypothetical protein